MENQPVKLKIGDKEYTLEEARELYLVLDQIFGAKTEPRPYPYPVPVPVQPFVPWSPTYSGTGDPLPPRPSFICETRCVAAN